ncbi:DUF3971 domain-containing protein [Thalassovita sp.]|uniref:YhdP family protein n=1 Tax=Thalassovita sp. TaxID=1979401 RepID=UPI0029DE5157|nr:DUF3971 domain-containing protein [Thalassovita sp.]
MEQQTDSTGQVPHHRRGWRWLWWSLVVLGLLTASAGAAIWSQAGKPIHAPQWLHARVEERLAVLLPGADIRFGDLSFVFPRAGRPRIVMRDAEIASDAGQPLLSLTELEARVAFRPLLEGKILLGKLRLSGASVTLKRRQDGTFDLGFGAMTRARQGASVAELIGALDGLLQTPELEALSLVEADGLTLQYEDALAGRAWTVDGARFELVRDGDDLRARGDLALLGGYAYATTLEVNFDSAIGQTGARFGMNFEDMSARDIASQVGALAWLEALRAPISGALRVALDDQGRLGPLSGTLQIREGVIQPTEETLPIPFAGARAYFTYDPAQQMLRFDELSVESQWISGRAEGKAMLKGMETGRPMEMQGQFVMTGLKANPDGIYPEPVSVDRADMTFRLGLAPFDFTMGQMSLAKDGHTLVLDGRLFADTGGWNLAVNGQVADLAQDTVLAFWPEQAKPKTRTWVAENIHALMLTNTQLAYRVRPGTEPQLYLGSEFRDGTIRFMKHMPVVTGAAGRAELMGNRFVVSAAKGTVLAPQGGAVQVAGTSLIIDDVRIKGGPPAVVQLEAEGTITAALSLLDREPLQVMTKANRPVTLADGRMVARGPIHVRLKKGVPPSEVRYDIRAEMTGVRSAELIPDRVLAAPRLSAHATQDQLVIEGKGRIGRVPFEGAWTTQIRDNPAKVSRVAGTVTLSQDFLDEFRIALPRGSVSGAGPAKFAIDLQEGREPAFALDSALKGIALSIPQLGWALAAAEEGMLSVRGRLGAVPAVDRVELAAAGLEAAGAVSLTADGQLNKASFSQVKAGGWLDAPVTLVGRGQGVAPAIEFEGGRADLRRMDLGGGSGTGGGGQPVPIKVRLDSLQITDTIALTQFRGNFTTDGGTQGAFTALVNGIAPVDGTMTPVNGRGAFSVISTDAGAVLAAAGLLSKAAEGQMQLRLTPVGNAGSYDGRLQIANVWLKEAPAMANLLNAASIIGLLEQLSGGGILFSEVDAKFRMTPEQVIVTKSSAVGASIGISMDGVYHVTDKRLDMQGVFSPVYAVNAVGSVLTRKGEGLIGFSFKMRGDAENPRVLINPLSVFTPGIFREIFRRPAPKVTQ